MACGASRMGLVRNTYTSHCFIGSCRVTWRSSILLDTDIVMVRDVRRAPQKFARFGSAVLGVGE